MSLFLQLNHCHCNVLIELFATCMLIATFSLVTKQKPFLRFTIGYLGITVCPNVKNTCGYCDIVHGVRDLDSLETLMPTQNLKQFVAFDILSEVVKY